MERFGGTGPSGGERAATPAPVKDSGEADSCTGWFVLPSLIALGIFLRSLSSPHTNFTFEDTLTQIGLGYPFLFLLGFRSPRWQWSALAVILFGYWLAWAVHPAAGPAFNPHWTHNFTGFAAHWNKDRNLGNAFDQ